MTRGVSPTREELSALAEKYRALGAMRRRELEGLPPEEDARYRALARQFPGALKELDQLELTEIDRREQALARAAAGGEIARWMAVVHRYHAILRELLETRRRLALRGIRGGPRVVHVAASLAAIDTGATLEEVRGILALRARSRR